MTGRRRLGMPPLAPPARDYVREYVENREPVSTRTVVMRPALADLTPPQLQALAEALAEDEGTYTREPVPDLFSADPADRTEYLREIGGSEQLFDALVADLGAMWLLDTTLPAPVRKTAPAEGTEPLSGASPAGESATAPAGMDAPPVAPDRVITDGAESAQEPDAEPDCADGGES